MSGNAATNINQTDGAYILQNPKSNPRIKEGMIVTMPYEENRTAMPQHNLIMEGRERAAISGVTDVESFDENEIIMATSMGVLFLRGTGLRIDRLSLDTGDVTIEGTIIKLEYEDDAREPSGGFFSRLFR